MLLASFKLDSGIEVLLFQMDGCSKCWAGCRKTKKMSRGRKGSVRRFERSRVSGIFFSQCTIGIEFKMTFASAITM